MEWMLPAAGKCNLKFVAVFHSLGNKIMKFESVQGKVLHSICPQLPSPCPGNRHHKFRVGVSVPL